MLHGRHPVLTLAALPLTAASCTGAHGSISHKDQVAIYSAALRAVADSLLLPGSGGRLLLDPRLLPPQFPGAGNGHPAAGLLDSGVVRHLPVAGVCLPTGPGRECGRGVRGLAAQLSVIRREGADRASVWLAVAPVQGAGDNTALTGLAVVFQCQLQAHDEQWRVVRAWRRFPA
jgi:hypothetical protein